jgi:hypothetical protein
LTRRAWRGSQCPRFAFSLGREDHVLSLHLRASGLLSSFGTSNVLLPVKLDVGAAKAQSSGDSWSTTLQAQRPLSPYPFLETSELLAFLNQSLNLTVSRTCKIVLLSLDETTGRKRSRLRELLTLPTADIPTALSGTILAHSDVASQTTLTDLDSKKAIAALQSGGNFSGPGFGLPAMLVSYPFTTPLVRCLTSSNRTMLVLESSSFGAMHSSSVPGRLNCSSYQLLWISFQRIRNPRYYYPLHGILLDGSTI